MTELGTFDDRDVVSTSVAITNAGDGLSQAMNVEPRIMHHGDKVVVVLETEVSKVSFAPVKDTDVLNRIHTLRAGVATIVDRKLVAKVLDEQARKIEAAKGVQRLDLEDDEED